VLRFILVQQTIIEDLVHSSLRISMSKPRNDKTFLG